MKHPTRSLDARFGRRDRLGRPGRRFHRLPRPAAASGTRAFTLVELLVAIVLLTVGLVALLSTTIATTRHMETAFSQIEAKALAARDIERQRSGRCRTGNNVENGLQRVVVVIERRTAVRVSADTFHATIAC